MAFVIQDYVAASLSLAALFYRNIALGSYRESELLVTLAAIAGTDYDAWTWLANSQGFSKHRTA